jgi:hypothetical protein
VDQENFGCQLTIAGYQLQNPPIFPIAAMLIDGMFGSCRLDSTADLFQSARAQTDIPPG